MRFEGAVVCEQGVTFAVIVVKSHVVNNRTQANDTICSMRPLFPGLPVILMTQEGSGRPTYYGRQDIVRFLARVPLSAIPWREYTLN